MKQGRLYWTQRILILCIAGILLYMIRVNTSKETLVCMASPSVPSDISFVSGAAEEKLNHLDPNSAGLVLLETVPGIGPKTAQAIIDEREKNGDFFYPEDLKAVKGIGEKKMLVFQNYFDFPVESD